MILYRGMERIIYKKEKIKMSFKAEITEKYTSIEGRVPEILAGLAAYINVLKKEGIPKKLIQQVVDLALEDKKEKRAETILDTNNVKVKKFDLNNMSKEEAKKFIEKEISKMFD